MKYNLKNRPDERQWFYRRQVKEWFEGFEKELREWLIESDYIKVKEILGDE